MLILVGHSQGRPSHPSRAPGLTRITLAAGMQFLEKGLSGLETAVHKVDALAAKVAVERGAAREAEPDELADDPNSFETAVALRSLASRLGDWTSPEGGVETEATLHGVLAELETAQATRDAAVRRRDEAETRLAEEIAVRDREEADALESASTIERELERERAAHAMTRSTGESRERGIRDESGEYDGMLEGVMQLTKERENEALEAEAAASAAKELERGLTREAQDAENAAQRAEDAAARGEAMDDRLATAWLVESASFKTLGGGNLGSFGLAGGNFWQAACLIARAGCLGTRAGCLATLAACCWHLPTTCWQLSATLAKSG